MMVIPCLGNPEDGRSCVKLSPTILVPFQGYWVQERGEARSNVRAPSSSHLFTSIPRDACPGLGLGFSGLSLTLTYWMSRLSPHTLPHLGHI